MFRHGNQAVTTKNIKEIELKEFGTGAKSNPLKYSIKIYYFGGETASICLGSVPYEVAESMYTELLKRVDE